MDELTEFGDPAGEPDRTRGARPERARGEGCGWPESISPFPRGVAIPPVDIDVSEWIHFGAGYRVYFIQRGKVMLLLLCGGDKSTQSRDIERARRILRDLGE